MNERRTPDAGLQAVLDELTARLGRLRSKRGGGTVVKVRPRHRRNAPCPCGSGRKFKACCLRAT
jgi:uncharacterized protein YecA (UPF0149 family)